jgi:hypothetical protein
MSKVYKFLDEVIKYDLSMWMEWALKCGRDIKLGPIVVRVVFNKKHVSLLLAQSLNCCWCSLHSSNPYFNCWEEFHVLVGVKHVWGKGLKKRWRGLCRFLQQTFVADNVRTLGLSGKWEHHSVAFSWFVQMHQAENCGLFFFSPATS